MKVACLLAGRTASLPLCLALASCLPAAAIRAETPAGAGLCADAVAAKVQSRYQSVRDLSAAFSQQTRSVVFGNRAPSDAASARGTVVFAKPGKMRWHYQEPQPSLVVSDGSTLWIVDLVAREAQRLSVGKDYLSGAALQFLLGEGDLRQDFDLRAADCHEATVRLFLRPRGAASYERIELRVTSQTGDVVSTLIVDLLGNVTEVAFSEVVLNRGPDASEFRFVPGADFEVIDLATPSR